MENYLNRIRKGVKRTVDQAKDVLQREGGLEKLAKDAVTTAGGVVSEGYTHLRNAATDETADPAEAAQRGKDYVAGRLGAASSAVARTKRTVGDLATTAQQKAATVRDTATGIAGSVRETIDDYAGPKDRTVMVGTKPYYIDSISKQEVQAVGVYLNAVQAKIPSGAQGRKDVLDFIAQNTITDYGQLADAWQMKAKPAVNALTYLKE